jgi:hypothetical protein
MLLLVLLVLLLEMTELSAEVMDELNEPEFGLFNIAVA